MACCDYPGCGKLIYIYNKEKNLHSKEKAHTVPIQAKQQVIDLLNIAPDRARKVQLIICQDHFRPDAYLESNQARLRRDLPFADLLLVPGTPSKGKRNSLAPSKPVKAVKDTFLNRTIAAPSISKMDQAVLNQAATSLIQQFAQSAPIFQAPRPPPPIQAPTPLVNNCFNGSSVSNNENRSKTDFDMKKFRIEVTMKHLLKEKELESKLKETQSIVHEYKSKLENAQNDLASKKDEASLLKAEVDYFKKELIVLKAKLEEENRLRLDAETKNSMLKGDLQITSEIYNAEYVRSKRIKLENATTNTGDEQTTSANSAADSDGPSLQVRLAALEEKLKEANDRREADLSAKDKLILDMKKEIKDLHMENQQLYDTNIALDMDIRAYRKLVLLEEQRTSMSTSKKRRTLDNCLDEGDKTEPMSPATTQAAS